MTERTTNEYAIASTEQLAEADALLHAAVGVLAWLASDFPPDDLRQAAWDVAKMVERSRVRIAAAVTG